MRWLINTTYRCNQRCAYCMRLIGLVEIPDSDVTAEQVGRFLEVVRASGLGMEQICVTGGEALLVKDLGAIMEILAAAPEVEEISLQTNGTLPERAARFEGFPKTELRISLPEEKDHTPWLLSPQDLGIAGTRPCWVRRCGWTFERWGFTYCAVAGALGRILGINPYSDKPQAEPEFDLCQHCLFSIRRPVNNKLRALIYEGVADCPSRTLRKGLRHLRRYPRKLEVF
jgi:hypothetical protein